MTHIDVSVVIPTRNRSTLLAMALRSVFHQQDVALEVIIVDEASTDETSTMLATIGDARVRVIRNDAPHGVSAARNSGATAARGEWLAFLDDDDLWAPTKLARQIHAAKESGRQWTYTGSVNITEHCRIVYGRPPLAPDEVVRALPHYNAIPGGGSNVIVRRETWLAVGPFDGRLRNTEDWEMWIRLARHGPPARVCSPLLAYRVHEANASLDVAEIVRGTKLIESLHHTTADWGRLHRWLAESYLRRGQRLAAVGQFTRAAVHGQALTVASDLGDIFRRRVGRRFHRWQAQGTRSNDPWIATAAAATLGEIFGEPDGSRVRWIEITTGRTGQRITLKQAPVNVANLLRERLFEKLQTVVLTSATLTTDKSFDYVKGRLGLDQMQPGRMLESILHSSFDYTRQVILGIPQDIPSPDHRQFAAELGRLVLESIQISQGRALVLFTSYSMLRRIHEELAPALESAGIRALMQGEGPRHRLTEIFKQDKTSVLFATDSFWEGVDVAGEALENVILTKLPFSVPKEPVIEARIEAIEQAGGNPFLEYSVPQAVIKFKQGFGRLIRSKSDRGSIMIFDRRVVDKTYGKVFLRSLPECRLAQGKRERVFKEVKQFFQETSQQGRGA